MKPLTTERLVEILNGDHDPFDSEIRRMCREILMHRNLTSEVEAAADSTVERTVASGDAPHVINPFLGGLLLRGGES